LEGEPMHIPDGFLSTPVWAGLQAVSLPALAYSARKAQATNDESRAPLLGVMGAFVFAAQMLNFPVGVGASGHLVGSALLSYTLGPAAAGVVMGAILAIQALVFQDGGVLAFGANAFNMALAGVWAAYLPYKLWGGGRAGVLLGGFLSVFVAAMLAILELLLSGVTLPGQTLSVALGVFAVTAAIEGAITLAVLEGIGRLNPKWVRKTGPLSGRAQVALGAAAIAVCAGGFFAASSLPDGLERLAQLAGLSGLERSAGPVAFPDYEALFISNPWLRKALAGLAGLALTWGVCILVGRWMTRPRSA
jgi:cobalt/nickel transport system permease protein